VKALCVKVKIDVGEIAQVKKNFIGLKPERKTE